MSLVTDRKLGLVKLFSQNSTARFGPNDRTVSFLQDILSILECSSCPHLPLKAVNLQFSFSVDKTESLHKQSSLQISSSSLVTNRTFCLVKLFGQTSTAQFSSKDRTLFFKIFFSILECSSCPQLPLKAVNLQFSFSVDKTEALHKQSSLQISSLSLVTNRTLSLVKLFGQTSVQMTELFLFCKIF